jgi:hypothetical protein
MKIYDLANPTHPVFLGGYTNSNMALQAVSGDRAFVLGYYEGLRMFDTSDPTRPLSAGFTNCGPYCQAVAVSGDHAYVVGEFHDYGSSQTFLLQSFDVSAPANPRLVERIPASNPNGPGGGWYAIAVSGRYAYMGGGDQTFGLQIYDLANPAQLSFVGNVTTRVRGERMAVSGNFVYLASGLLEMYDVSNPANPCLVGQILPSPWYVRDVAVSGNYVYLALGVEGLGIYLVVPQLTMAAGDTETVQVSWAAPPVNNFVLQQNSGLATTDWLDVTNVPVVVSNRNELVLPVSAEAAFYRLRSP